jgi:hypothetical protein
MKARRSGYFMTNFSIQTGLKSRGVGVRFIMETQSG